jgi:ubiquinone/menaquinone biosynthesis C-methylase UbiE
MTDADPRQPHAVYERERRLEKGRKIRALITRRVDLTGAHVLEIGCGSGHMAEALSQVVGPEGRVAAVDRYDQRHTFDGYEFTPVEGTTLPFGDAEFDVVISNHVMEHVGDVPDQVHHLTEIKRVMRDAGLGYVSVPNRWRVIEPHFRLPLLSWFPQKISSAYVRLARKGDWYDVVPPSHRRMRELFTAAGLAWEDCTVESMEVMADVETVGKVSAAVLAAPEWVRRMGMPVIPSMIYIVRKPS